MKTKKLIWYSFVVLAVLLVLLSTWGIFFTQTSAKSEVLFLNFLDVGQGDASLIQSPYGQNILIDGGDGNQLVSKMSEQMRFFDRNIDLMILTHPHADHVTGLIEVLERYKVNKILYTGRTHSSPDYLAWLEEIKKKNLDLIIIDHPQKIKLGPDCVLDILYPFDRSDTTAKRSLNNTSMLIKLVYGNSAVLFTGDLEHDIEEELIKKDIDLRAEVLKIAHHGSDSSSIEEFLDRVDPDIALIGVGEDNKFSHPSKRVLNRLSQRSVDIYRTDELGTIRVVLDKEAVTILP